MSLTTTVCFWLLGSGQDQKWPLTVKSNRFCCSHFLAFPLHLMLKTNPSALSLRTPSPTLSPTLAALCMSPLDARHLDSSCCPCSLDRGENPHSLVMKASIPLKEVAVLISLCWCNEWLRLMLTSDKLLGTMGLKVWGLLSGCQDRTRHQLSEVGYPQHQMSESLLFNETWVVRNLSNA